MIVSSLDVFFLHGGAKSQIWPQIVEGLPNRLPISPFELWAAKSTLVLLFNICFSGFYIERQRSRKEGNHVCGLVRPKLTLERLRSVCRRHRAPLWCCLCPKSWALPLCSAHTSQPTTAATVTSEECRFSRKISTVLLRRHWKPQNFGQNLKKSPAHW